MVIAMTASAIDAFAPTCQKERGETLMASCNTKKLRPVMITWILEVDHAFK